MAWKKTQQKERDVVFEKNEVRLLAFAGSCREGSFNKKLVTIAAHGASNVGATVTVVDLKDYSLPVYDTDLESAQGLPDSAVALKNLMNGQDGFLIATPEYNSAITPLLKNMIDWTSRRASDQEPMMASWRGKAVGLMSASPGSLGGLRSLMMTREILANIGVLILPEQRAVSNAGEVFDEQGMLKDDATQKNIEQIGARLVKLIQRLKIV